MMRRGVIAACCTSYAFPRQQIELWDGHFVSCESSNNPNLPENRLKKRPCEFYNSTFQKIWWRERRNRCNTEEGCNFSGWSYTGTCDEITPGASQDVAEIPLQSSVPLVLPSDPVEVKAVVGAPVVVVQDVILKDLNTDAAKGMASSLLDDMKLKKNDTSDLEPVTTMASPAVVAAPLFVRKSKPVIVTPPKPTIASSLRHMIADRVSLSAAITVKESEDHAKEAVKIILREALNGKENRNLFGEFLTSIFVSPELLTPIRDVIYWSVADEIVMKGVAENMEDQRDFLLGFSAELEEGQVKATRLKSRTKGLVDESLMTNVIEWFEDPKLSSTTVIPLLDYALKLQDETILPLAAVAVDVIPWAKAAAVEGITSAISEGLQSEEVRKSATDAVVAIFRQSAEDSEAAREAEAEAKRKEGEETNLELENEEEELENEEEELESKKEELESKEEELESKKEELESKEEELESKEVGLEGEKTEVSGNN